MKVHVAMAPYDGNEIPVKGTDLTKYDPVKDRLELLSKALLKAFPKGPQGKELQVFLAPEYYFRKGGFHQDMAFTLPSSKASNFTSQEYRDILEALKHLTVMKERIIIPGTIFWLNPSTKVIRNTLPVFYKGELVYVYHKHTNANELSEPDKLVATGNVSTSNWQGYGEGAEEPCFELDVMGKKLVIGLEVCADHQGSVLKGHLGKKPVRGKKTVDLQCIVGNTVGVKPAAVCAHRGGYLLLCSAVVARRAKNPQTGFINNLYVARVDSGDKLTPMPTEQMAPECCRWKPFDL